MEDKENILNRVVGFLYDALDNFKTTMDDVNNSLSTLMNSLQKVDKELKTLGIQPIKGVPLSADKLAARIKASSSMSSKERLVSLFSGTPMASTSASSATPFTSGEKIQPKPAPAIKISGPPKSMKLPTRPVPSAKTSSPPIVMKPPSIPTMKPPTMKLPTMKPPTGPTMKPSSSSAPGRPSIMKPPVPPLATKPIAAGPMPPKPGGSIIGLRDEMLKELRRLKSIMKGG